MKIPVWFCVLCALAMGPDAYSVHIGRQPRSVQTFQPMIISQKVVSCPCLLSLTRRVHESTHDPQYTFNLMISRHESTSAHEQAWQKSRHDGSEFEGHFSSLRLSVLNATHANKMFHHFDLGYIGEEGLFNVEVYGGLDIWTAINFTIHAQSTRSLQPACPVSIKQDPPRTQLNWQPLSLMRTVSTKNLQRNSLMHLLNVENVRHQLHATQRISGGNFASTNLQRYMVSIYSPDFSTVCSGTLISPKWVLTVAHCRIRTNFMVSIGTSQAFNGSQLLGIRRVVVHPSFEPIRGIKQYKYDIAVLKLKGGPPRFSKFMRLNDDVHKPADLSFVRSIGYGVSSIEKALSDSNPYKLRQVDLPVMNHSDCQSRYAILSIPETIADEKQICAGYSGRKCDTCAGDSGGPLVQYIGREPILVGITSFGVGCGDLFYPSVFIRISAFLGWLKSTRAVFYTRDGVFGEEAIKSCEAGEFVYTLKKGIQFCRPCPLNSVSKGGAWRKCRRCEQGLVRDSSDGTKCSCVGFFATGRGIRKGMCRLCPPDTFSGMRNNECKPCPSGTRAEGYGNSECEVLTR